MATKITNKIVDSNVDVSNGGRAKSWWFGKHVKPSFKYSVDSQQEYIDQYQILAKFSLKGFEYGNWLNNEERHDRLSATNESLHDLTKIMRTRNIGCDGMIGIAFGARGKSKAAAHFEPGTFMINLTKENGFGALAHEYGHAIDYFFVMFVDQDKNFASLVGGRSVQMYIKPVGGDLRKMAMDLVNQVIQNNGVKSASYQQWEQRFKNDYWFRRNEIFARTFEQFVRYKLNKNGIKNTFLSQEKYESASYLVESDMKRIVPLMDRLINEMEKFMNNKKLSFKPVKSGIKTAAKGQSKTKK